jgi:hypothetical protein
MAANKAQPPRRLRTVEDLIAAGEWLFHQQESRELDAKSSDAMNTTLKGQRILVVDTRMALLKMFVTAQVKKFRIPPNMLPPGLMLDGGGAPE